MLVVWGLLVLPSFSELVSLREVKGKCFDENVATTAASSLHNMCCSTGQFQHFTCGLEVVHAVCSLQTRLVGHLRFVKCIDVIWVQSTDDFVNRYKDKTVTDSIKAENTFKHPHKSVNNNAKWKWVQMSSSAHRDMKLSSSCCSFNNKQEIFRSALNWNPAAQFWTGCRKSRFSQVMQESVEAPV